jgi:hypothetical protein
VGTATSFRLTRCRYLAYLSYLDTPGILRVYDGAPEALHSGPIMPIPDADCAGCGWRYPAGLSVSTGHIHSGVDPEDTLAPLPGPASRHHLRNRELPQRRRRGAE